MQSKKNRKFLCTLLKFVWGQDIQNIYTIYLTNSKI